MWRLVVSSRGVRDEITARVLVNATGPWIGRVNEIALRRPVPAGLHLVKGSHIVVRRLFDHDRAYIFQNADGRVVFAIPYEGDFTLVGTTDHVFRGEPGSVVAQPQEITYLCRAVSEYLRISLTPEQVVWTFAGVRSLYGERGGKPKDLSRDYVLALDGGRTTAPLLSVYGGKLTTARRLAEAALRRLTPFLHMPPPWTDRTALPGGDFPWEGINALVIRARGLWPFLTEPHARRLVRAYGTRLDRLMGDARRLTDLGTCFGADLTAAEVDYLSRHEWAETADDVLWRRSKLGLHLAPNEHEALARYMEARRTGTQAETPSPVATS